MRPAGCVLLVAVFMGPAAALEPTERATLDRPGTPVVLTGSKLKHSLDAPIDQLRLYAWQKGSLRPIPFQVDELTSQRNYAFTKGEERRSDTDDGRLDDNDELVFMARDAGPRLPVDAIELGQSTIDELVVSDRGGAKAWVYLLRFPQSPPPRSQRSYLTLDWRKGELAGWKGDRVQVTSPLAFSNVFYLHQIRFATKEGWSPDVLDRAKIYLKAHYLYLTIQRRMDELRAHLVSWCQGPVRAVASFRLETYLIWGHWVRSTKACQLTIYGNRLEVTCELALPVDLEKGKTSELRFSLDLASPAGDAQVWSDRNRERPVTADGREARDTKRLERRDPAWLCINTEHGAMLARLELLGDLEDRALKLFVEDGPTPDPPEDETGSRGNAGFSIDLTGLAKGSYSLRLSIQFGESLEPGEEKKLLRVEDAPLTCTATQ